MSATLEKTDIGKVVTIKVSGKLTRQDYDVFLPEIERSISEHGKIRVLFEMVDFHGWDAWSGKRVTNGRPVIVQVAYRKRTVTRPAPCSAPERRPQHGTQKTVVATVDPSNKALVLPIDIS